MSPANASRQPLPEDPSVTVETLRQFRHVSIYGWALLLFATLLIEKSWSGAASGQWLLQAGLLWMLVLHETKAYLPLNRKGPEDSPYVNLGLANRLTIVRGWLIACTGGFLFQPSPVGAFAFAPAGFYAISAVIDRLDGYAARRTGQVSQMGIELDTVFDALGMAIAPLLAVWYGKLHWSYLLVSCAYYLFKWGQSCRQKNGLPVFALQPKLSRRAIAGFQMGFIAVALFPTFQPPATRIAGFAFMLPVLIGFMIDWLVVSGRVSDKSILNHKVLEHGERLIRFFTQPLLRLVLAGSILTKSFHYLGNQSTSIQDNRLILFGMIICGALILLGIMGRTAALVVLLLLGWPLSFQPIHLVDYVLLPATVWILVLGTGFFSLCTWDEDWVNRYDGE